MASFGKYFVGFFLLAGVLGLSAAVEADVSPLLLQQVEEHVKAGDTASAFAILETAIKDPETSLEMKAALLAELAQFRLTNGDYADAGEAFALQAQLVSRSDGALAPELASLQAAAADAYAKAGDPHTALPLAEAALRIDLAYFDCASAVLADDHARLADLHTALGNPAEASTERKLATDSAARCEDKAGPRSRGVVVTNEFATATPDSFARVKVFYATDRARTGSDRPNEFYGGGRGDLDYGEVEVTVPRVHKPGEVESPSILKLDWSENPERHFVVTKIATMTSPEMFASLRATLASQKSDEAFVFVHGFNVSFTDAAKRTAQIAYDLNFQGAPILYSWPSAANTLAYIRDEAVVRLSGRHFVQFLDDLAAQSGAKHIYLIAHSMGNRVLADALELMATRRAGAGETTPLFDQVIFAAPDEDALLFSEMLKTIRPIAQRLTLYGSDNDRALQASEQIHGAERRAGQAGPRILVSGESDSIDMSVLGEDMMGHGYFASSTSALTDISWLFWRNTEPDKRCGMDTRTEAQGKFWIFDTQRCDGPVMLSALTLLKSEGTAALAKVDKMLGQVGSGPNGQTAAEEWKAIRNALIAATSP